MISNFELYNLWFKHWKKDFNAEVLQPVEILAKKDSKLFWINSGIAAVYDQIKGKKGFYANDQKCIRLNDIENVGVTGHHHTYFNMFGAFWVGKYNKKKFIKSIAKFFFETLKLDKSKAKITVHENDLVSYNAWLNLGFSNIIKQKEENEWKVEGLPGGICTEIYYNDIEICNVVFNKEMIDCGVGKERLWAILEDKQNDYESSNYSDYYEMIQSHSKVDYFANKGAYWTIIDHLSAIINMLDCHDYSLSQKQNTGIQFTIKKLIRHMFEKITDINYDFNYLFDLALKLQSKYWISSSRAWYILDHEYKTFQETLERNKKIYNKNYKNKQLNPYDIIYMKNTYGINNWQLKRFINE